MNLYKIILGIHFMAVVVSSFKAQGNLRPAVTFASGLSPRKVKMIRLVMRLKCRRQRKRLGRFANNFC